MRVLPAICQKQPGDLLSLPCKGFMKQLVSCDALRDIPPNQVLHSQGEIIHNGCFLCEGIVKISHLSPNGKRMIVTLRKGGWVPGIGSIVGKYPYPHTAETLTRCKVRSFSSEQFRQMMETDAKFATWVAHLLASAVYNGTQRLIQGSLLSGRERLERFLCELFESMPRNCEQKEIKLQSMLKNFEIAQLLSLTPQHLARIIKQMEIEGILIRQKGWIILKDLKKLKCHGASEPSL